MDILHALILGVVQGLTEFLPISSSGHLILAREFFGIHGADLAVDAVLQLATALAILVYFRHDFHRLFIAAVEWVRGRAVADSERTLLLALICGTIPAVVAGLALESYMESVFRNVKLVAWVLIAGSGLFVVAEWVATQSARLTIRKGIGIGFFQCLALIPGMSRSGATIAGGLIIGLTREEAARFAFLLAMPVIVGSGAKKLLDLAVEGSLSVIGVPLLVGAAAAFLVGIAVIHYLLRFLKHHTLMVFVVYRLLLAAIILIAF